MFINLTPHPITIRNEYIDITIEPSGQIARVEMQENTVSFLAAGYIPVIRRTVKSVSGLPLDGSSPCLVSSMVLAALPKETKNVYAPDTGPTAIRDENGQIVAVTRLVEV